MPQLPQPTIIVICGWPLSGKTETAKEVQQMLGVHHVDIDEVRWLAIGKPNPHPNASPELMKRDVEEMRGAYLLLNAIADWHLEAGRSLILTATFSRKNRQGDLTDVMARHLGARLRVIQCIPHHDEPDLVQCLLERRGFGDGAYKGAVNSVERYLEVKNRYQQIDLPHIEIPTWGSCNTPKDCADIALRYILQ